MKRISLVQRKPQFWAGFSGAGHTMESVREPFTRLGSLFESNIKTRETLSVHFRFKNFIIDDRKILHSLPSKEKPQQLESHMMDLKMLHA